MSYKNIVILTGAGISAESGISTFRDSGGLWDEHRIEDVATPEGYARNPELVLKFYNTRRQSLKNVKPNAAHVALAKLEQDFSGSVLLITQNVDDLHERAGSKNLRHMHGELLKIHCTTCGQILTMADNTSLTDICPNCGSVGKLRPHIVWFGEMPLYMDEITAALTKCDLFMSIGTSGNVYPAAGFVQYATAADAHTVELNLEDSIGATQFKERIYGKATEIVPAYIEGII
jgi:NAD-dependent deacetylase